MCLKKCGLYLEFVILPYSLLDEVSFWPGQTFLGRPNFKCCWLVGVSKLFVFFYKNTFACIMHCMHIGWVLFFGLQCMLKCTKNSVEANNNNYIIHSKPKKGRFDWNFGTMLIIQCNFKKIKILRKIEDIYVFCKIRRNFFRS